MIRIISLGMAILFTLSFGLFGASDKDARKAKIKEYFEKVSTRNHGYSGKFATPVAFRVGQYVVFGVTDGKKKSVSRTAIIANNADGLVIETWTLTEKEETAAQICFKGMDKVMTTGKADDIEIAWIKMMDKEGKISKMDGMMLKFMPKGPFKDVFKGMNAKFEQTVEDGGAVTVPAGTFGGTIKFKSKVKIMGSEYKSTGWYHRLVPVGGMVKTVSDNGKTVQELLEYGFNGKALMKEE